MKRKEDFLRRSNHKVNQTLHRIPPTLRIIRVNLICLLFWTFVLNLFISSVINGFPTPLDAFDAIVSEKRCNLALVSVPSG